MNSKISNGINIKNTPIILAIAVLVVVFFIGWQEKEAPSLIENFDDCAAAGNPVMESYPRQCVANGETFIENIEIKCTPQQKEADECIQIYQPVCASVSVECIKAPCDPIKQTFSNSCTACSNSRVDSYVNGECLSE